MQTCPIHNVALKPLFQSYFCPVCEGVVVKSEVQEIHFDDMSPRDKILTIARDVIERIDNGKIVPIRGMFLTDNYDPTAPEDHPCTGCALGALLVCHAKRKNFKPTEVLVSRSGRHYIHETLKEYFSSDQLYLIETAFEVNTAYASENYEFYSTNHRAVGKAFDFAKAYEDREDLLKRIMINIVDNNGTFVP